MKTDQELEQLMRATFANRAATVTRGPGYAPTGLPSRPEPRVRTWLAVAACAAVILAVTGGIVLADRSDRGHPVAPGVSTPPVPTSGVPSPAPNTPTPSTSTTTSNSTKVLPPPATTCTTALPAVWQSALRTSVLDSGSPTPDTANTWPLSVSGNEVIALRDDSPIWGSGREVVLLSPGHSPRTLYSVPEPNTYNAASADVSGNWLVVGVELQGRQPKNTIGGNTPDAIDAIVAVDMTTGRPHVVVASPDFMKTPSLSENQLTVTNAAVLDGKVYWTERSAYQATKGTVKSYDLNSGALATVATNVNGPGYLVAKAEGLVIDPQGADTLLIAATLPGPVAAATDGFARAHLSFDGTSYAWAVNQTSVGFWRPGMSAPTYATIPGGFNTDNGGGAPVVAGEDVITVSASALLTDMLTKATATVPESAFPNGRGQMYFGSNGVFAGYANSGITSHYVSGYWLDSPSDAIELNTTGLGKLSC